MSAPLLGPRAIAILAFVGGISLVAFLVALAFGDELARVTSHDSDSFSRSALGHHAFVELLRELDVPVTVSRSKVVRRLGPESVLVVAEPPVDEDADVPVPLERLLRGAPRTLVVLPKRFAVSTAGDEDWIRDQELYETEQVDGVLRRLGIAGTVTRADSVHWGTNAYGVVPDLDRPQVIAGSNLIPLVSCDRGILLGVDRGATGLRYVLSDPDLIATHGLGRGQNGLLAFRMVEEMLGPTGAVVIDETLHGHVLERGAWSELFRFPLLLVTLQVAIVAAVLLWSSTGRFGAPAAVPPEFAPGKDALLRCTAELLQRGDHAGRMLRRYLDAMVRDVARVLHAPPDLAGTKLRIWLDRIGTERGASLSVIDLHEESRAIRRREDVHLPDLATRIHRWKTEILHARPRSGS